MRSLNKRMKEWNEERQIQNELSGLEVWLKVTYVNTTNAIFTRGRFLTLPLIKKNDNIIKG